MTIVIRGTSREGDYRISSKQGIPVVEETWKYIVEDQYPYTEPTRLELITTAGLPVTRFSTQSNGLTVCKSKSAERSTVNKHLWIVTAEFSSEVEEGNDKDDPETDPETWKPVYETKFERISEVVTKDFAGTAIANSAGQPFETGLTRNRYIPVWEFYQFEPATLTDEQVIARNEKVNTSTFKGRAAKTLLLNIMSSTIGYYLGQRRRLTKYSLKYNDQTWQHKRLDVGTVYVASSQLEPYLDNKGNVILGPLNGSGGKVTAGSDPAILTFDVYEAISFSFLRV